MTLAAAVNAALVARARTGEGQLVSTSLYRQGAYTVSFDLNTFLLTGRPIAIGQRESMGNPCMNNYTAADGRRFWIVGLEADRHWPPLCRAVGHPEWLADSRFATARDRARNSRELIAALDEIFAARTLAEWAEIFGRRARIVLGAGELDGGRAGRRAVPRRRRSGRRTGRRRVAADGRHSCRLPRHPVAPRSSAPKLGEHTEQILGRTGRTLKTPAKLAPSLTSAGVERPRADVCAIRSDPAVLGAAVAVVLACDWRPHPAAVSPDVITGPMASLLASSDRPKSYEMSGPGPLTVAPAYFRPDALDRIWSDRHGLSVRWRPQRQLSHRRRTAGAKVAAAPRCGPRLSRSARPGLLRPRRSNPQSGRLRGKVARLGRITSYPATRAPSSCRWTCRTRSVAGRVARTTTSPADR